MYKSVSSLSVLLSKKWHKLCLRTVDILYPTATVNFLLFKLLYQLPTFQLFDFFPWQLWVKSVLRDNWATDKWRKNVNDRVQRSGSGRSRRWHCVVSGDHGWVLCTGPITGLVINLIWLDNEIDSQLWLVDTGSSSISRNHPHQYFGTLGPTASTAIIWVFSMVHYSVGHLWGRCPSQQPRLITRFWDVSLFRPVIGQLV